MHSPTAAPARTELGRSSPDEDDVGGSAGRWSFDRVGPVIAGLAAVVPIFFHVVQNARAGWTPTSDAAATVLRARHALGTHPTLVGMFTDATNWTGQATYFPGPWQLYWLAGPTRILGNTWGPLVAMALLNVCWTLLGGWFAARRAGPRGAVLAFAFLAMLQWGLGGSAYLAATPMVMIVPAFATFLIGMWIVADGDVGALPGVTVVGGYLVLDHLVLSQLVPVVALVGLALGAWSLRRDRRREPDGWPTTKRRLVRSSAASAALGLVLLLPAIIQQLTNHPGNVTNLARAAGARPAGSSSIREGARALFGLVAQPPFWLRPSRDRSPITSTTQAMSIPHLVVFSAVILLVLGAATWVAVRRRDRTSFTALVVASSALAAAVVNMARSPARYGIVGQYFLSSWSIAMFTWFAVALTLVRATSRRLRWTTSYGVLGVAVLFGLLNLPHANFDGGTTSSSDAYIRVARSLNDQALPQLRGGGTVRIAEPSIDGYFSAVSLALALDEAGIPYCVDKINQLLDPEIPVCGRANWSTVVTVRPASSRAPSGGGKVIASASTFSRADRAELAKREAQVRAAIDAAVRDHKPLTYTEPYLAVMRVLQDAGGTGVYSDDQATINPPGGAMSTTERQRQLAETVYRGTFRKSGGTTVVPVEVPGLSAKTLLRWATLVHERDHESYELIAKPRR